MTIGVTSGYLFFFFKSEYPEQSSCLLSHKIFLPEPKSQIDQGYQGRNFNQWTDDARKSLTAVDAENTNVNSNRQLENVTRCRKCDGRGFRIMGTNILPYEETDDKHYGKINNQRKCNSQNVEWNLDY